MSDISNTLIFEGQGIRIEVREDGIVATDRESHAYSVALCGKGSNEQLRFFNLLGIEPDTSNIVAMYRAVQRLDPIYNCGP